MVKVFIILVMMASISYCSHEINTEDSSTMNSEAPSCSGTVEITITGTTTSQNIGEVLV